MNGAHIKFLPNVPVILSLADAESDSGCFDFDLQIGRYQTVDGQILALPRPGCVALNLLGVKPGEEIGICKHVEDHETRWVIWLTPKSEQERARLDAENPPELTEQLAASIAQAEARKGVGPPVLLNKAPRKSKTEANPDQPRLFDRRGTGTDGPAPVLENQPAPLIPAASSPTRIGKPAPIPWNVAFREVSAWVAKELKANDLQWSDEAQQAMVCTVLIQEAKKGTVAMWERES